jgi:hypothetical protein
LSVATWSGLGQNRRHGRIIIIKLPFECSPEPKEGISEAAGSSDAHLNGKHRFHEEASIGELVGIGRKDSRNYWELAHAALLL